MSFSQPHRYKLYVTGYWTSGMDDYYSVVTMSSIPSKEDVIAALRNCNQLDGYTLDFIEGLIVERPDGWYYKKILVHSYTSSEPLWKFIPSP